MPPNHKLVDVTIGSEAIDNFSGIAQTTFNIKDEYDTIESTISDFNTTVQLKAWRNGNEWWKAYEPGMHDTKPLWAGPFPDGYMHEEWLGLCSQGNGSISPFLRQLRRAYYMYKELWTKNN